ncbi:hypothetical protein C8N46_11387 [Kordia periserrulae]|uniref:Uncharacterized protein n=1 Tax=Kordia periserrulae TaxID=701523 RepID=A0A2T6BRC1_9FLAO|nr:hypothetical protein C8N46_11387 [Kordia periserrulae]
MSAKKSCKCTSKTRNACGNCSRLRMVFLMDFELGSIQNPVYYSFQAEDRKYKDDKVLAEQMFERLSKLHRGRYHKIEVYDNQASGKPKLLEFKKNETL